MCRRGSKINVSLRSQADDTAFLLRSRINDVETVTANGLHPIAVNVELCIVSHFDPLFAIIQFWSHF